MEDHSQIATELKYIKELFQAGDAVLSQRIDGLMREIDLTEKANATAIAKSDAAYEKRFESMNEFRQLVTDREVKFMGSTESRALHKAHEDKMNALTKRFDISEGRDGGKDISKSEFRSNMTAVIGIAVGLASLFLFLSGLSNKVDRNTVSRVEQTGGAK